MGGCGRERVDKSRMCTLRLGMKDKPCCPASAHATEGCKGAAYASSPTAPALLERRPRRSSDPHSAAAVGEEAWAVASATDEG